MFSKKAQLEINETIIVLIIFIIMFLIGLIIFHRFMSKDIEHIQLENERNRLINLLATLPDMPEVKCSSQKQLANCIDTLKLFSFKLNSNKYFDFLGYKQISVIAIYPKTTEKKECNSLAFQNPNYPENCNYWILYDRKPMLYNSLDILSSPISLYYPLTDEHKLGLLQVGLYH